MVDRNSKLTGDQPSMPPAQHASHPTAARNFPDPRLARPGLGCNFSALTADAAVCTLLHQE